MVKTGTAATERTATAQAAEPAFWRVKTLGQMSAAEWEALCDGCGRCCLNKFEDADTGEIFWTSIACRLLDPQSCRCTDYRNRFDKVPDCIGLDVEKVASLAWLPPTCAYRLVHEGRDLYWWHPLVSGTPETVHEAGISVRGRTIAEDGLEPEDYEDFLVDWPGQG
ncbi:MAG: UPF0260 protein [Alphaproteobacteria bacterium]|nr:MAG: UPF0260 protein [Alphaproteobacteria bacterium]